MQDDPEMSPFGPEIADIEISSAAPTDVNQNNPLTRVTMGGCNGLGCKAFCYKLSVSKYTVHMTLELFKRIMDRMPPTLLQIAFGVCSIDSNPDVWAIFEETRRRGIAPNVTINAQGVTDEVASKLASLCGAVAVSVNPHNKETAYSAVEKLTKKYGMSQVNFHVVLANETTDFIKGVVDDIKNDSRLSKLNAMVMLAFKDKGNTRCFKPVTQQAYADMVNYCEEKGIRFGFDSCSAHTYLKVIKDHPNAEQLSQYVEPCESGLFSIYINVFGNMYACSFCENVGMWESGLNVLDYSSVSELWNCEKVQAWRQLLLNNDRECPFYEIGKQ